MTKVEKMKIEGYIDILEEEIETIINDIYSMEFFLKKMKRYIKESEVENEEGSEG